MNENLLEIHSFEGLGYKPLIDYGAWRVAVLRYIDDLTPNKIERVERHNETDEVFVLLDGKAVLFIGEGEQQITALHPQVLGPGKMYNVKRHTWHTVVLSKDASILLVENQDTGEANSDYAALNTACKRTIIETAAQEQPEFWSNSS